MNHFDTFTPSHAQFEQRRQEGFEETVVRKLLGHFKLAKHSQALKQHAQGVLGQPRLLLSSFYEFWPTFPLRFLPNKITHVHLVEYKDIATRFTRLKIFDTFKQVLDEFGSEGSVAAVFHWAEISGTMAIHNMAVNMDDPVVRTVRGFGNGPVRQVAVMEPMAQLLESIHWKPD